MRGITADQAPASSDGQVTTAIMSVDDDSGNIARPVNNSFLPKNEEIVTYPLPFEAAYLLRSF